VSREFSADEPPAGITRQPHHQPHNGPENAMAKAANIKIKLLSSADTGYFYVTSKNSRTKTDKLSFRKYDPIAKKHVDFKETKIK
jgi:large subunit ribosomal protein L33